MMLHFCFCFTWRGEANDTNLIYNNILLLFSVLKGIVYPKMKILSLFTHLHVISKPYAVIFPVENYWSAAQNHATSVCSDYIYIPSLLKSCNNFVWWTGIDLQSLQWPYKYCIKIIIFKTHNFKNCSIEFLSTSSWYFVKQSIERIGLFF